MPPTATLQLKTLYYFQSWWGLVGLLPILTGTFRFCPAYLPFGLNTCATKPEPKACRHPTVPRGLLVPGAPALPCGLIGLN